MHRKYRFRVHVTSLVYIFLAFLCTSCTINMIQTDTHGVASDIVDSDPTTDVKPQTDLSIPISPI